jgi:hypothetical protein
MHTSSLHTFRSHTPKYKRSSTPSRPFKQQGGHHDQRQSALHVRHHPQAHHHAHLSSRAVTTTSDSQRSMSATISKHTITTPISSRAVTTINDSQRAMSATISTQPTIPIRCRAAPRPTTVSVPRKPPSVRLAPSPSAAGGSPRRL